jgi:hypothetical protein
MSGREVALPTMGPSDLRGSAPQKRKEKFALRNTKGA